METPKRALRNLHLENEEQLSTPLHIPPSPFMKKIGFGTGVEVYRLDRGCQQSPWAVKKLATHFRAKANPADTKLLSSRIQDEAEILRKLSHPNIVGYRGVAKTSAGGIDTLALECCNTSLGDILEERNAEDMGPLSAANTLSMINDVARALDYLHSEAGLLHGDLKSYNVLVKGEFEICKLCDFGVSLKLDENGLIDFTQDSTQRYIGTNIWSAPEIIDESDVIDSKVDIFSFGLVIYETIALVPPHTLAMTDDDDNSSAMNTSKSCLSSSEASECDESALLEAVEAAYGTRPPLPQAFELSDAYNTIVEIFYLCTDALPESRPSAASIWKNLDMSTNGTTSTNDQ